MQISPLGLDHVVIRVADLDRSIKFYCDILGCQIILRREDLGLYHLQAGQAQIDLVTIDGVLGQKFRLPNPDRPNVDHFCLRIEPFDTPALVDYLASHDLETSEVANRFGSEGYGPSLYVEDPDGNTVELKGATVSNS